MQQKILSNISIGKEGRLVVGGAVITQKSPLYDRLATPDYLNPRAFSGAELVNFRLGQGAAGKFAGAIAGTAMKIRAECAGKSCENMKKAITAAIAMELGTGIDADNILGSRNTIMLAMFDIYAVLNMEPELSVGQNYDLALNVGGVLFSHPDEKARYKENEREEQFVALMPAQACSAVHLILGKEAEQRAQDRKRAGDTAAWKTEIAGAIRHYEEAVAFDIGNDAAIYNLSGAYATAGQHGKAADIYKKAFELSQGSAKAYYAAFLAENTIYARDIGGMIGALRMIEGFSRQNPQYVQAREAAEDLRAALTKALSA